MNYKNIIDIDRAGYILLAIGLITELIIFILIVIDKSK